MKAVSLTAHTLEYRCPTPRLPTPLCFCSRGSLVGLTPSIPSSASYFNSCPPSFSPLSWPSSRLQIPQGLRQALKQHPSPSFSEIRPSPQEEPTPHSPRSTACVSWTALFPWQVPGARPGAVPGRGGSCEAIPFPRRGEV